MHIQAYALKYPYSLPRCDIFKPRIDAICKHNILQYQLFVVWNFYRWLSVMKQKM